MTIAVVALLAGGCSETRRTTNASDAASPAASSAPAVGSSSARALAHSNIRHLVVIVQEDHTFDSYFGRYCTAPPGSNPSCTTGAACCEAAPDQEPSGSRPIELDDVQNGSYDPDHSQRCELLEIDHGRMDRFVRGAPCSNKQNFAIIPGSIAGPYHDLARRYALADRYFQPVAGESSSNDMYFAVARYVFADNSYQPNTTGSECERPRVPTVEYSGVTTIADLLVRAGYSFAFYAEGFASMAHAHGCPAPPADCPPHVPMPPCVYEPSNNPFLYYAQLAHEGTQQRDLGELSEDLQRGTLPDVAFVKPLLYRSEHPGHLTTVSTGASFVRSVIEAVLGSPTYSDSTLILVTWDEGGGYYDHVSPPADSAVDGQAYGTRVPLLAIGRFARANTVSHVTLEHSSIVRFIEWNFLGGTGQLGARDAVVHGLGGLLDPLQVGEPVPD